MTDPRRHDFAKLIAELQAAGVTVHQIAKMTHRQFVQVQRWRSGVEPKHFEGEMLIAIHQEFCCSASLQIEVTKRSNSTTQPANFVA